MTRRIVAPSSPVSIHIKEVGFSDDPYITRFRFCRRETYIVHYVTSGRGFFNGNAVKAGEGFLITPGMPQEYHPSADRPWEFLWVIASGDDMERIFPYYAADPRTQIFSYPYLPQILHILEKIKLMPERAVSAFETLSLFLDIFKYQVQEGAGSMYGIGPEAYAKNAAEYIETYYFRKLSIREITRMLGVSQPYLFRVFKAVYGKSPKQYLDDYRLLQAKALLREPKMPVAAVAQSVGFEDPLNFSKFFSKHEGVSPSAYRRGLQAPDP